MGTIRDGGPKLIPFYVLIASFVIFRTLGFFGIPIWDEWQESLQFAVGVMFLLTASAHWGKRRTDLIRMIPLTIPNPRLWVTLTGVLEIIGAIGMNIPQLSLISAIGLTCLLLAMFPANIYAARHGLSIGGRPVPPLLHRTLLQIVFIVAVLLTI